MTDDLDSIPFGTAEPRVQLARPRRCRHPRERRTHLEDGGWSCACGHAVSGEKVKRGRNAKKRGLAIQRKRVVGLGGRNLAGNNENLDGIGEMFAYESKSGGAFSERQWRYLKGIPRNAQQIGVLIVTETPGPGFRARSYVVVDYDDWRDLHGETKEDTAA